VTGALKTVDRQNVWQGTEQSNSEGLVAKARQVMVGRRERD
jgi:hypothetical protein